MPAIFCILETPFFSEQKRNISEARRGGCLPQRRGAMNNDRYFGKADPLLDISLCPLCAGSRVLIALCSSLLGVTLVLKRFSFIGDGLSHVAFGAMAIGRCAGADRPICP